MHGRSVLGWVNNNNLWNFVWGGGWGEWKGPNRILLGGFVKYIHLTSTNVLFMKRIVQRKATDYFYCKTNKLEL